MDGDGWFCREMGGYIWRWVVKYPLLDYLSYTACYGSSLGSNPDISQKYKIGDINKGVANAL
jgi:hypothetical protein